MKIQLVNFVVQGLCFSMKLLGFTSKAIKVLLTELIGQRRYIAFSVLTDRMEANTETAVGNTDLALIENTDFVNKASMTCVQLQKDLNE